MNVVCLVLFNCATKHHYNRILKKKKSRPFLIHILNLRVILFFSNPSLFMFRIISYEAWMTIE